MKLKLSRAEFDALYKLLQAAMDLKTTDMDLYDRLVYIHIWQIYVKFYSKAVELKQKYNIEFSDEQTLSFYIFYTTTVQMPAHSFEGNLITKLTNNIHQKYLTK